MTDFAPGAVFEIAYPFCLEDATVGFDDEGPLRAKSWRPGVRWDAIGPEDDGAFANGVGKQIVTVVSTHKPAPFPERVFYTRQWETPEGKRFGKGRLFIKTVQGFRSLIKGYRYTYELDRPFRGGRNDT